MQLSEKQIEQIKRSRELYLTTDLKYEEIAIEVGLDNAEQLRILWTVADQSGALDKLGL